MSYSKNEDEIKTIFVRKHDSTIEGVTSPKAVRIFGPGCDGCQNHDKALMLSYSLPEDRLSFYDTFLDAKRAEMFLAALESVGEKDQTLVSLDGDYVIEFEPFLGGGVVRLRPSFSQFQQILKDVRSEEEDLAAYVDKKKKGGLYDVDPEPRRITEQEIKEESKRAAAFLDDYYKPDPRDIPLSGIDMGVLLAALYNNAKTGGMGTQHFVDRPMTPEEGRHILSEIKLIGALPEIDCINGRSVKVYFNDLGGDNPELRTTRYWDYNGIPVVYVIESARKGEFNRISGQGVLDVENEVRIIIASLIEKGYRDNPQRILDAGGALAESLEGNQTAYVYADAKDMTERFYQLSICGDGAVNGEVGHLIKPFRFPLPIVVGSRDSQP